MAYSTGTSNAKKHCYAVYVRVHGIAGGLDPWTSGFADLDIDDLQANVAEDLADWATGEGTYATGDFGKLGALDEKPTLEGSEGEELNIASCDSITIAEMIEGSFNQIEVTKGNYDALRGLAANGYVDILYFDADYPAVTVGARKVRLKVFPKISGNDLNRIEMTFKKDVPDLDDYFAFVTMAAS